MGGPHKKDYSSLGSVLGSPYFRKLPMIVLCFCTSITAIPTTIVISLALANTTCYCYYLLLFFVTVTITTILVIVAILLLYFCCYTTSPPPPPLPRPLRLQQPPRKSRRLLLLLLVVVVVVGAPPPPRAYTLLKMDYNGKGVGGWGGGGSSVLRKLIREATTRGMCVSESIRIIALGVFGQ